MADSGLLGFFRRLRRAAPEEESGGKAPFAKRHHSFKLFLTEWNNFQTTMTQVEYTLCCEHPFGLHRVHKLCTDAAAQLFQCIRQLQKLDPAPCEILFSRFEELRGIVASVLDDSECRAGESCGHAAKLRVLPFDHPQCRIARASFIRLLSPEAGINDIPGFVVSLSGCRHFFQVNGLYGEIARRVQAAGGPVRARLTKLSRNLSELVRSFPVPDDLAAEIGAEAERLRSALPGRRLLVCLRLWVLPDPADAAQQGEPAGAQGAAGLADTADFLNPADAGLFFCGPVIPAEDISDKTLAEAFRQTLAWAQQRKALMYRRTRGLTESCLGLSAAFLALPENQALPPADAACADDASDDPGDGRDHMPGSPVFRILQNAARYILPLTLRSDSADFTARNCATYHDIVRYCHKKALSSMFAVGSDKRNAAQHVKQLKDGVLKQFWVVNLNDGFASVPAGPVVEITQITSRPMLSLWRGMNVYPWQGPPPLDGKGFMAVLFEATANPHLDPAAQSVYFSEKNYFMVTSNYCSLHSRFGFHFVSVEARLGERRRENYLLFQLRGGAADIERRILRVRLVAEILWEFGFRPRVYNDAVSARLEGMTFEDGEGLLAVAGYMSIHTRQLDMIMQNTAQTAARKAQMLTHCRALFTGRDMEIFNGKKADKN
jgi:hypothetical protein